MSNTLQKHRTKLDKTKQTKGQKRCLFSSYNCRVEMTLSICHSWLEGTGVYCYARVMRQTCSQSATDVTMLMTILYSAKWTRVVNEWCTHGKSPRIGDFYELLKQYSIVRNFTTCDHH